MTEEKKSKEAHEVAPEGKDEAVAELSESPEELRAALEEARARAEEYLDQWKRAEAAFANFKKRNEKEREEFFRFANGALIAKIIPILDDFERALATVPGKMYALTWLDGIFLIQRKLLAVLQQEGVKEIEVQVGAGFDPNLHEAVAYEGSPDHQEGQIIEVLQKGYMLHDRIIRPALVRVAK